MLEFDKLLDIAAALLGPKGCPWDKEQTLDTLKPYILEEIHELLEAIDLSDPEKMKEELGDCFYSLIFLVKLAEQKQFFTLQQTFQLVAEKLIRRHPHVFGELKVESPDEVLKNWEEGKKKEGKKHPIAGIPATLPALARAQKVISKVRRMTNAPSIDSSLQSQEELGQRLWRLVQEAELRGFDAEAALRKFCLKQEESAIKQI